MKQVVHYWKDGEIRWQKVVRFHEFGGPEVRLRLAKRSFDDLRLKFNLTHFRIIRQGLAFGLRRLNQLELADCFNDICPCGSRKHSPEYLAKLRKRIVKALKSLQQRNAQPTSF